MSPRATLEIANIVGIGRATLERWLVEGKIPFPKTMRVGRRSFRLWTEKDVERILKYKEKFYRKGRGRRKKKAYK